MTGVRVVVAPPVAVPADPPVVQPLVPAVSVPPVPTVPSLESGVVTVGVGGFRGMM